MVNSALVLGLVMLTFFGVLLIFMYDYLQNLQDIIDNRNAPETDMWKSPMGDPLILQDPRFEEQ